MRWKSEDVQISLDEEVNKKNMSLVIARQLIRVHGEGAHLIALSEMLKDEANTDGWRQVLDTIDEINKGE
jgi:hypothetical protein